jgi:hypothetical protein
LYKKCRTFSWYSSFTKKELESNPVITTSG